MYDQRFQRSMDQTGMVANPARDQLNRENVFSLVPLPARPSIGSRGTGSAVHVTRQVAHSPRPG